MNSLKSYMKIILIMLLFVTSIYAQNPVYNKIAFSRMETMNDWDIWIMNRDGTGQVKLINNLYRDTGPCFNPQGTKITFGRVFSTNPMQADIFVMNADGSNQINLTNIPQISGPAMFPKFSWDGEKIVFDVQNTPGNGDLYIMNKDGTGLTPLLTDSNDDSSPYFSPNGEWVVFMRQISMGSNPKAKICKVHISGSPVIDLTNGNHLDETPVFSACGNFILFKRGFTQWDLFLMPANHNPQNDSDLVNMTNTPNSPAGTAMYSWEGDKIVFYEAENSSAPSEIFIMNIDGSGKQRLTNDSFVDFDPTFSPEYPIPVELTNFCTSINKNIVTLFWETKTELNNAGFEIERSNDSNNFIKIGFVKGEVTSTENKNYMYVDKDLSPNIYYYRLKQIDLNGAFKYSDIKRVEILKDFMNFSLSQNYPNPFGESTYSGNPTTTLTFTIAEDGFTTLKIYDILGREVQTLVNEELKSGQVHKVEFDGSGLASGVYLYRLESNYNIMMRKFLLIR